MTNAMTFGRGASTAATASISRLPVINIRLCGSFPIRNKIPLAKGDDIVRDNPNPSATLTLSWVNAVAVLVHVHLGGNQHEKASVLSGRDRIGGFGMGAGWHEANHGHA